MARNRAYVVLTDENDWERFTLLSLLEPEIDRNEPDPFASCRFDEDPEDARR